MAKQLTRLSLFAGALALIGSAAQAGQCPADKVTIDGQKPGATVNAGATDSVIASIDLAEEAPGLKEHALRLRRLVIEPGGTVAWHSPRRAAGDHLHRLGKHHRVPQHVRGADRS
jgi:hypothetical protein